MKLNPWPDGNVYFMSGGVSLSYPSYEPDRDESGIIRSVREQPSPWPCHYCGTLNPFSTWKCSGCQAPRTEPTKSEQAIWQPPVRVVSHEEPLPTPIPTVAARKSWAQVSDKPPPPWWAVLLMVSLWLGCIGLGILAVVSMLFAPSYVTVVLVFVSFLCYYVFGRLRGPFRDRYQWGTGD